MNVDDSIALIIPAFRPNQNLLNLVQKIKKSFQGPIIVVNDGNEDQTIFQQL